MTPADQNPPPQPTAAQSSANDHPDKPALPGPSWVGKKFSRFKIIQHLGKGSMGSVYRGEDINLKRHVALKVFPKPDPADTDQAYKAEQFIREARSAARLEHPHAVRIYEVDQYKNWLYIAMELVEGGNLHELVKATGPLDAAKACTLCADAAEALHDAHQRGVFHRDIKPANLVLTRDGRCKLTDFGLATLDDPEDGFDLPASAYGTPSFVAPETTVGQPATPQTEIYSLAATLFFLLTGRPVFPGKTVEQVVRQHRKDPAPRLDEIDPSIPADLADDIARALSKKADDRFESCKQFALVLRRHTVGALPTHQTTASQTPDGQAEPPDAARLAASSESVEPSEPDQAIELSGLDGLAAASETSTRQSNAHPSPTPAASASASASASARRSKTKSKRKSQATAALAGRGSGRARKPRKPDRTPMYVGLGMLGLVLVVGGALLAYQLTRDAEPAEPGAIAAAVLPTPATPTDAPAPPPEPVAPTPAIEPVPAPEAEPEAAAPAQPEFAPLPEPELPPRENLRDRPVDIPGVQREDRTGIINVRETQAIQDAMQEKLPVTLQGVVASVSPTRTGSGARLLFTDAKEFYLFYQSEVGDTLEEQYGGRFGSELVGKTIRVNGRITPYYGKPQIKLEDAVQLWVIDPAAE